MMKKALVLLLVFVFCLSTAYAEDSIWVKETWGQIDREVDCNGHPLLIHAKILEIPADLRSFRNFHHFRMNLQLDLITLHFPVNLSPAFFHPNVIFCICRRQTEHKYEQEYQSLFHHNCWFPFFKHFTF